MAKNFSKCDDHYKTHRFKKLNEPKAQDIKKNKSRYVIIKMLKTVIKRKS